MNPASVILPCNFNRTPPCMFFEEWTDIFWDIYCLVCQIIIVLIGLRKGNCQLSLAQRVKSHKGLKQTESFPKVALAKNSSEKFHKFHVKEPLIKSFLSQVVACNFTEKELFLTALKVFQNSYSPFLLGVQFCFPFVNTKFVVSNANYSLLLENLSRKTNLLIKYNNL